MAPSRHDLEIVDGDVKPQDTPKKNLRMLCITREQDRPRYQENVCRSKIKLTKNPISYMLVTVHVFVTTFDHNYDVAIKVEAHVILKGMHVCPCNCFEDLHYVNISVSIKPLK